MTEYTEREIVATRLALDDGVELLDVKSTVIPREQADAWRKYLAKADDLLSADADDAE